jgi:uncharacterized protein (UPF0332 family)
MNSIDSLMERANKYLNSVKLLFDNQDYESCVSRVYYAMYYSTEAVLLTKQLSFTSHKGVLSGFGLHFVKTGIFPREMSKQLNQAFEKKQLGDYSTIFAIEKEEAKELFENDQSFVKDISQYLKQLPPSQENL